MMRKVGLEMPVAIWFEAILWVHPSESAGLHTAVLKKKSTQISTYQSLTVDASLLILGPATVDDETLVGDA
jgi:hypothetical protein